MNEAIKALIEAGKGSVDYLAFLAIAVIGVWGLTNGLDFLQFIGVVAVLILGWLVLRYGLFRLQYKERLQNLQLKAISRGLEIFQKHATPKEIEDFSEADQAEEDENDTR